MARASEAYPWQLVLIRGFPIDCTKVETHNFESDVSEFPVESGSVISDNVRNHPVTIDLECIVSNTPVLNEDRITVLGDVNAIRIDPDDPEVRQRSTAAYLHLIDIRDKREPVQIRSSRGIFENMVLKSLSIPRDASTGDAIVFRAMFQQITIVDNERNKRVAIPIAQTGGAKTKPTAKPTALPTGKTTPGSNVGPFEGTRHHTFIYRNGNRVNVWFDPAIGFWRESWYETLAPASDQGSVDGVPVLRHQVVYTRGPMLDGFTGTDTQMMEHAGATTNPDKLLIKSYEPWKGRKGSVTSQSPKNIGLIHNVDGTPGLPDTSPAKQSGTQGPAIR